MWVPLISLVELLNCNRLWTEWHVGKQKLSAWRKGAYKTFCGMCVTNIFFNGMCVNHSPLVLPLPLPRHVPLASARWSASGKRVASVG
jgi:hypothetical protein